MKSSSRSLARCISLALAAAVLAAAADESTRAVGPQADGSIVVSDNQRITPAGTLVDLGSPVRAKAVAVNPSYRTQTGAVLIMGGAEQVIVFNIETGEVMQRYTAPNVYNGSFAGIAYTSDGRQLLFSDDYDNLVAIANADLATGELSPATTVAIPPPTNPKLFSPGAANAGGIAISDGSIGLVAINASNTLGVFDVGTGTLKAQVPVGNAPNHVVTNGRYAYVSNEGGRPATPSDFTNLSDGTPIVADPVNAAAITGTVSVVDLESNGLVHTIGVGLHPAGMALSGSTLYVANSYSDSISVIDTHRNEVIRTIHVGVPVPGGAFGAGPNDIAIVEDQAYVTLGQSNAIAVVDLEEGTVRGYIPTAYFPTSIAYDKPLHTLVVADDKGSGTRGSLGTFYGAKSYGTHQDTGVVNLIPIPLEEELKKMTAQVVSNNHWDSKSVRLDERRASPSAAPVAIPAHIGEPSLIKHVFLIIKENRTYDQMLGDVPQGNGDASLAVFGGNIPNQKALIRRFPLIDNAYAPSRQSADGHPWIVESGSFYSNDIESPDWVRSYPGGNSDDALSYTPRGFIWSQAEKKGLNVKMYGEWSGQQSISGNYSWADFYNTALYKESGGKQGANIVPDNSDTETTAVPSASAILDPHYPSFNTGIPDQYRVDYYLPLFEKQVATNTVPDFTILWLPDDHTSGFTSGFPVPQSAQADNDLALGRIVEAISHSSVWPTTAIFVEEDDAQNGVDHVDGHRQPIYVISPYAVAPQSPAVGRVIHTTYTAENINRTIEHILGLDPLTQFDRTVAPMFDCFQNTPNTAPFDHVPANTPLNVDPNGPIPGTGSASVGKRLTPIQRAWLAASNRVMKGKTHEADAVDENFLNHLIWYSATGWQRPYPGEGKILSPRAFPKAMLTGNQDSDD
ncbi:MAG TPA: bifunctional YncE family protein/alkaline phosphatase family protein [Steroidobacteraceae bacterium]|nr:bifunctional YncE family protein/alkaline phosphatase family protein [Steroidobacteraceae bacterium]